MQDMKTYLSLALLLTITLLSGCASNNSNRNTRADLTGVPQVDLSRFQRVAVGRFTGTGAKDIEEDLTEALASDGRFKVIDRNQVKRLIKEGKLAANGLIDQKTAVELGRLTGVAAYIDGRVSVYNRRQESDSYKFKDKYITSRVGIVTVEVAFNVVDLETGQILLNRKILKSTSSWNSNLFRRSVATIDYAPLFNEARQAVIQEFMRSVAKPKQRVYSSAGIKADKATSSVTSQDGDDSMLAIIEPNTDSPLNLAWVQKKLNEMGYECGEVDGYIGPNTHACIGAFQSANNLSVTGRLDDLTVKALLNSQ